MKKFIPLVILSVFLTGCGSADLSVTDENNQPEAVTDTPQLVFDGEVIPDDLSGDGFDYDLTSLNANMMYGQVFDMMTNPDKYMGKSFKIKGLFSYYQDPAKKQYFSVYIPDAGACCGQGIEFVLRGEHSYPDDYPEPAAEITVTGTFNAYEEYAVTYCQLTDAEIVEIGEKDERYNYNG